MGEIESVRKGEVCHGLTVVGFNIQRIECFIFYLDGWGEYLSKHRASGSEHVLREKALILKATLAENFFLPS